MPGPNPTDRAAEEQTIGRNVPLDRRAVVTSASYGDGPGGPEFDLRWAGPGEDDQTDLEDVPYVPPVPGVMPGIDEGDAVIVRWLAGTPPKPYIAGVYYNEADSAPSVDNGKTAWSLHRGGSRIALADDGSITLDASAPITLTDPSGTVEPTASAGGNGGNGGSGGGEYPTVPSGDAGGSGEGIGDPGYSHSRTVDAVADLGMDNSGGSPINSALENAATDGTKIEFPPGTYLFDPPSNGMVLGVSNFAMLGTGETRDDVRFVYPAGKAGRMLNFAHDSSNVHIANLTFDQSNDPATGMSVAHTSSGDMYVYNVQTVGKRPVDTETGPPMNGGGITSFIMATDAGATTHIANYQCLDGPERLVDYPDNTTPIFAGNNTSGDIQLVNCNIQNSGEHAVYASRTKGTVKVVGGLFARNRNTNARISGQGSALKDATIVLDAPRSHRTESDSGNQKAARGLRFEAGNQELGGKTGGVVENCDMIKDTDIEAAGMLIQVDGNAGAMTMRNNRFFDSSKDQNDVVQIVDIGDGPQGIVPPTPHSVTAASNSFTGSGTGDAINSQRQAAPTRIENNCQGMSNSSGFTGYKSETGTSTSGCERPQTQQSSSSG